MKARSTRPVWILLLLSGAVVGSIAAYVHEVPHPGPLAPQFITQHLSPPVSTAPDKPAESDSPKQTVTVYVPQMSANGLTLQTTSATVPRGTDPKVYAVNQFLKQTKIAPEGSALLGVDMHDGVAHLGFNSEFQASYGSFDEKKMIDGLAAVLGQFPDVNAYVIEINGTPLQSIGSVDLSKPVDVIRSSDINSDGSIKSDSGDAAAPSSADAP